MEDDGVECCPHCEQEYWARAWCNHCDLECCELCVVDHVEECDYKEDLEE